MKSRSFIAIAILASIPWVADAQRNPDVTSRSVEFWSDGTRLAGDRFMHGLGRHEIALEFDVFTEVRVRGILRACV